MKAPEVYLIEAKNGMVKIGCGLKPESRLNACATHCSVPVRMIAKWDGCAADEKALHLQFHEYRSHREWFSLSGAMAAFVADVRGRGVDRVPEWDELENWGAKEVGASTRALKSEAMKRAWADPMKKAEWLQSLREGRQKAKATA